MNDKLTDLNGIFTLLCSLAIKFIQYLYFFDYNSSKYKMNYLTFHHGLPQEWKLETMERYLITHKPFASLIIVLKIICIQIVVLKKSSAKCN